MEPLPKLETAMNAESTRGAIVLPFEERVPYVIRKKVVATSAPEICASTGTTMN